MGEFGAKFVVEEDDAILILTGEDLLRCCSLLVLGMEEEEAAAGDEDDAFSSSSSSKSISRFAFLVFPFDLDGECGVSVLVLVLIRGGCGSLLGSIFGREEEEAAK